MLKKVTEFLLKYRYIVLVVIAVILAVSIVGTVYLVTDGKKINSDMMSYLSEEFDTRTGLNFLQDNFGIRGDATIVVRGKENDEALRQSVEKIKKSEGISQLIWVEDAYTLGNIKDELEKLDLSKLNEINFEGLIEALKENEGYKTILDAMNADDLTKLVGIADMEINTESLEKYLKRPIENSDEFDYVLVIMHNYAPSTSEAYALLDSIKAEFSDRYIASSGMTETAQVVMTDTLNDLPNFLIFAVIAVIIILLITTSSFIDPLIIMFTLGVSILISMGANYLYPSISIISFATSAVLQLAITMDYSIFYMHVYKRNRRELLPYDATVKSVPEVAGSILASALTTIGGFVALYFMRFGIGADIAGVIIKGVVLSLLTILILQPIITLLLDKAIEKTTHDFRGLINKKLKERKPDFDGITTEKAVKPIARFSVWARIVLVIVAVGLLVPCYIGQSKLNYTYFQMYEVKNDTPEKALAQELGNQMIMAVPLDTVKGTHKDFINAVLNEETGKVSGITGAFTAIDLDVEAVKAMLGVFSDRDLNGEKREPGAGIKEMNSMIKLLPKALENENIADMLRANGVDVDELLKYDFESIDLEEMMSGVDMSMINSYFAPVDGKWYTLYTVGISGSAEDDTAAKTYENLLAIRKEYFGNDGCSIGMLTGSYDMRTVTPTDFLRVTIASAAIIFLIISILLRNPLKSLILVIIIELGIWINLSFTFLLGEQINFMIYIIISSVQLGCTVDYAILLANTFENNRKKFASGKECAVQSAIDAVPAIFISALLIIAVCLSVYGVSQNLIIKQLTGMLARGAAISFVLVTFIQTAVMSFFKTERRKIDFASKIKDVEEKLASDENAGDK